MTPSTDWLPLGSLVVAALAVFVGPWLSLRATRLSTEATLLAANKQIVAPMRQAWIDALRNKIAEVLSTSWWYYVSGQAPTTTSDEDEAGQVVERRLQFLVYEIDLMLNPNEPDHQLFLKQVRAVVNACLPGSGEAAAFPDLHVELAKTSKGVLKREWNRVKAPITIDGATE